MNFEQVCDIEDEIVETETEFIRGQTDDTDESVHRSEGDGSIKDNA